MRSLKALSADLALLLCITAPFCKEATAQAASTSAPATPTAKIRSRIYTYRMFDHTSRQVFEDNAVWEAPVFLPDGNALLATSGGALYKMAFGDDGSVLPARLPISEEYHCVNAKAISPNGKLLAFSAAKGSAEVPGVYVTTIDGTNIRRLTTEGPSYVYGWAPDGKSVVIAGVRGGNKQSGIYSVAVVDGKETPLVTDEHQNDAPEYSPDGKWLYFSSDRSSHVAIWRVPMNDGVADTAKAEKVIEDGLQDRLPHLAGSGGRINYIAYPATTTDVESHTSHVELKGALIDSDNRTGAPSVLVGMTGGKGSLDSNAWNPDSDGFAYVMYDELP